VSDGIQAIGSHAHGRLRNPTDLLALSSLEGSYFQFVKPKEQKYYGTTLMAQFLKLLGESLQEILPGQKLLVGSVSDANGGSLPPHSSHQTGLDADISYLVNDPRFNFSVVTTSTGVVDAFLAKENWQLFKKAFATNLVAGIFVDRKIRNALCAEAIASGDLTGPEDRGEAYQVLNRISVEAGHHHHFHVRLKCPENENEKDVQKRCEVADPGTETVNCFSAVPKTVQQSMKK
jgi:penicillin-insensitive murein endopeptidase